MEEDVDLLAVTGLISHGFDLPPDGLIVVTHMGGGKTSFALEAARLLGGHYGTFDVGKASPPFQSLIQRQGHTHRAVRTAESARKRFRETADALRAATTLTERRTAARAFLAALAELVACLLEFLVGVLLLLLSRLSGCVSTDDARVWKPAPIETTPQIAPRGPNPAPPVSMHRGGHHRSALGSAVSAA